MTFSRRQFLVAAGLAPMAATMATQAAAATHNVTIQGFQFSPQNLTISRGDTVRFTNADSASHTATSASAGLDTGRLRRNESGDLTFETAGTFAYVCAYHGAMRGTITVT